MSQSIPSARSLLNGVVDLGCVVGASLLVLVLTSCDNSQQPSANAASDAKSNTTPVATAGGKYTLGSTIRFGKGGESERFRQSGWSETEQDATWTIGDSATLVFQIDPVDRPLNLRMSLAALAGMTNPKQAAPQPVEVRANGEKIADWQVTTRSDFNAVIPPGVVKKGGPLTIELKTAKAVSPKTMGVSDDERLLGVYCFEMAITP